MWRGLMGSLGPCGGGGIAGMVMGSQWCSRAERLYRAAVMMCWACSSRTMWRSVLKVGGLWGGRRCGPECVGWGFFPRLSPATGCPPECVGVGVLVVAVQGRGTLLGAGGWRVPWTCWAGCICLGPLALCPGTCCALCWGLGVGGAQMSCTGQSRAGHGAHNGSGRGRMG